jgi:hypothetical protein
MQYSFITAHLQCTKIESEKLMKKSQSHETLLVLAIVQWLFVAFTDRSNTVANMFWLYVTLGIFYACWQTWSRNHWKGILVFLSIELRSFVIAEWPHTIAVASSEVKLIANLLTLVLACWLILKMSDPDPACTACKGTGRVLVDSVSNKSVYTRCSCSDVAAEERGYHETG